jgi:hypothetical protein
MVDCLSAGCKPGARVIGPAAGKRALSRRDKAQFLELIRTIPSNCKKSWFA